MYEVPIHDDCVLSILKTSLDTWETCSSQNIVFLPLSFLAAMAKPQPIWNMKYTGAHGVVISAVL